MRVAYIKMNSEDWNLDSYLRAEFAIGDIRHTCVSGRRFAETDCANGKLQLL